MFFSGNKTVVTKWNFLTVVGNWSYKSLILNTLYLSHLPFKILQRLLSPFFACHSLTKAKYLPFYWSIFNNFCDVSFFTTSFFLRDKENDFVARNVAIVYFITFSISLSIKNNCFNVISLKTTRRRENTSTCVVKRLTHVYARVRSLV